MPIQRISRRNRFSNRPAIVFAVTILLGLIIGSAFGHAIDGVMTGAIAGALLMIAPGIRDRPDPSEQRPAVPPHTSRIDR